MDRTEFKKRMQSLKSYRENNPGKGYWDWRNSLPDNLKYTNDLEYDMRGAYESGAQPELADDGLYHLPTRHPKTGKILKASTHPTYWEGLTIDSELGYKPYFIGDNTYTWNNEDGVFIPWQKVEEFDEGGQTQRRELGDSPYEDPRIEDRFKPRFELRKGPISYYGNLFTKLAKAARPINVLGTVGEFVQNVFPSKEQEYLNNIDTYFDKQARNKMVISVQKLDGGGEVPPDNSPARINPITGKPLANGAVTPVLDLEGAANFTPVGDVLSIRDMYVAARNKNLLGLGLAGLGILPFMSRIRPIDRPPIPTVNKDAIQRQIDLSVSQTDKNKKVLDDFYNQRNSVYESLIENEEAFRRAARADRRSGTSYMQTYQDMVREYGRDGSNLNPNLAQPGYDRSLYEQPVKAQVSTSNPDLIRLNPRYKDPEELDETFQSLNPGLIRHEMGHSTDIKSGLDYTKSLADPSKFEPESRIKEMYPKSYKTIQDYLLNGSEIKSHMNEFRDFLFNKGEYQPKETINSIRKKLDKYGSQFKNLNILFDLYKNKRQFVNDYNLIPITATENNDNLV